MYRGECLPEAQSGLWLASYKRLRCYGSSSPSR